MPSLEEIRKKLRDGFSLSTENPAEATEIVEEPENLVAEFSLRVEDNTSSNGMNGCAWWVRGPSYGFRIGAMEGEVDRADVRAFHVAYLDPQRGLIDRMHHNIAWTVDPESHNWATFEKLAEEILRWHKLIGDINEGFSADS